MHRMRYRTLGALLLILILGCHGEYAAILDGHTGKPLQVLSYRVASFPPADQAALRQGIALTDPRLLEDFFS